jgi:hypothetical protein
MPLPSIVESTSSRGRHKKARMRKNILTENRGRRISGTTQGRYNWRLARLGTRRVEPSDRNGKNARTEADIARPRHGWAATSRRGDDGPWRGQGHPVARVFAHPMSRDPAARIACAEHAWFEDSAPSPTGASPGMALRRPRCQNDRDAPVASWGICLGERMLSVSVRFGQGNEWRCDLVAAAEKSAWSVGL